jgi:hypothetical protein
VSRLLAALLFCASTSLGAMTLDPVLRCDGPVVLFDMSVRQTEDPRTRVTHDLTTLLRQFVARVCGPETEVREVSRPGRLVSDVEPDIVRTLASAPPAIAIILGPYADIEAGVAPPDLLALYRRILDACDRTSATCIVAGQQPVEGLAAPALQAQIALEQAAARAFADRYLPIHRYFRSRLASRNLMKRLDLGDGKALTWEGHLLLFTVLQKRLISSSLAAGRGSVGSGATRRHPDR